MPPVLSPKVREVNKVKERVRRTKVGKRNLKKCKLDGDGDGDNVDKKEANNGKWREK